MGELVTRASVMGELVKEYNKHFTEGGLKLEYIETAVYRAPDVGDVRENVHGNWIGTDDEPHETWKCNRCGYGYEGPYDFIPNFCPNCGADMRGEIE